MAQKSKRVEGLEGVVEDNHTVATRDYETKAELQAALDEIAEACVDALPDLDDSESEDDEASDQDDETDE